MTTSSPFIDGGKYIQPKEKYTSPPTSPADATVADVVGQLRNVSATHLKWWDERKQDGSLATAVTIDKAIALIEEMDSAYRASREEVARLGTFDNLIGKLADMVDAIKSDKPIPQAAKADVQTVLAVVTHVIVSMKAVQRAEAAERDRDALREVIDAAKPLFDNIRRHVEMWQRNPQSPRHHAELGVQLPTNCGECYAIYDALVRSAKP